MQAKFLDFFAQYIEKELGIVYGQDNYFQLEKRLNEILRYGAVASIEELHSQFNGVPRADLKQLLLDIATNNETSFFRDNKLFSAFKDKLVPELIKTLAPNDRIKIWSSAASTGQEAFSIAMSLEMLRVSNPRLDYEIWATDISERVLKRITEGRYSQLEVQRGMPAPLLLKYFKQQPDGFWLVSQDLKNRIKTSKLNLLSPLIGVDRFHFIFCRNMLIYQRIEKRTEIVKRLSQQLLPNGALILGSSESLIGVSSEFEQLQFESVIVYKLKQLDLPLAKVR